MRTIAPNQAATAARAALAPIAIDENSTYSVTLTSTEPGRPARTATSSLTGTSLHGFLLASLQGLTEDIKQDATGTITSWKTSPDGSEHWQTFTAAKAPAWTSLTIPATDLVEDDTVLVDGVWRTVLDTWTSEDDPAELGEDDPAVLAILDMTAWYRTDWIAARYVDVDQSATTEIEEGLLFLHLGNVVQVRREMPATPPVLARPTV
ncbi:hypothetical protein ACFWVB_38205 [Streptomyces microflavus]|uniref:hypothetical protein n=1 Tax=Streptomyces microflavus TaxID=1919 RepID=UPI00364BEE67